MMKLRERRQTFSEALDELKKGYACAREGWNGKGLSVIVQFSADDIPNLQPFFLIYDSNKGTLNTWMPSVSDLFAEDWVTLL